MLHFRQAIFEYDGQYQILKPNQSNSFESVFADFKCITQAEGIQYSLFLHPKKAIRIQKLELQFDLQLSEAAQVFSNGYQSDSESRYYGFKEAIPALRSIGSSKYGASGDSGIPGIPRGKGYVHSWTYTLLKDAGKQPLLLASLHEKTGFTLFIYDVHNALLTVRKEIQGLELAHSFPALHFFVQQGPEAQLFQNWQKVMDKPVLPKETLLLGSASPSGPEGQFSSRLQVFSDFLQKQPESSSHKAYFMIPESWQKSPGDWLQSHPRLAGGVKSLSTQIKSQGLQPALWLAPFIASKDSDLVRRNPEWLLRDKTGNPLHAGWSPKWGGHFFALDFYQKGLRDYLSGVFHLAVNQWGIALFELDLLYAAALCPPSGKTRGQVMQDVMEFLRQQIGNKKMLASGVPLGSCLEHVDYVQNGAEGRLLWEDRFQDFLHYRERAGALNAIRCALGRWPLNGLFFQLAPGPFSLQHKTGKLNAAQQHSLLLIQTLLGSLLHCTDEIGAYSPEQEMELAEVLCYAGSEISSVTEIQSNFFQIALKKDGTAYQAYLNLNGKGMVLSKGGKELLKLEAWEGMVLS